MGEPLFDWGFFQPLPSIAQRRLRLRATEKTDPECVRQFIRSAVWAPLAIPYNSIEARVTLLDIRFWPRRAKSQMWENGLREKRGSDRIASASRGCNNRAKGIAPRQVGRESFRPGLMTLVRRYPYTDIRMWRWMSRARYNFMSFIFNNETGNERLNEIEEKQKKNQNDISIRYLLRKSRVPIMYTCILL